jgi:hypothetical protein
MAVWLRTVEGLARAARGAHARGTSHPFSVWVTLVRNPLRTLPMMLATLVASLGVAAVVALADSVVRTAVAPMDYLRDAVVVRTDPATLDVIAAYVRQLESPPSTTRLGPATFVRGKLFQFDMYFPILVVADGDSTRLLQQYGDHIAAGRLPAGDALEVAIPAGLAKTRSVTIGDTVGGPNDFTPLRLKIVGLVDGPRWIGVASAGGVRAATGPAAEGLLLYEADAGELSALEQNLHERYGAGVDIRHWTPRNDATADPSYDDLQLMLSFIVGVNATVLSIIGGLLALLYFRQRQAEFVLLSLLGWTKRELGRHLIAEIVIVVGVGWLGGLIATQLLLAVLGQVVLSDRAVVLDFVTPGTLLQTFPLALITIAVSGGVTLFSLSRFDAVSRLQARA